MTALSGDRAGRDADAVAIRGRGVHYLDGEIACPLAGVGARGEHASIRLAFDDDASEATFDRATRRLTITNRRAYAEPTLFGDLIVLGHGRTKAGATVPISMHTRFDKTGTTLKARPHLHPTVAGTLASIDLEPLVVVIDGERVLDPVLAHRVATHPPLVDWLGRALFSIQPDRPPGLLGALRASRRRRPGSVVDLTVGLGVGRLAVPLVRAELDAGVPTGTGNRRGLVELLSGDEWSLSFTVLSRLRDLREHLGRAVFLLGLADVPILGRVQRGELERGERLRFTKRGDEGTIEVGRDRATIDNIADAARAYLEYDILGSVIAEAVIAGASDEIVV